MCGLQVWTHLLHPPYLQRPGQVLLLTCVHLIAVSQETGIGLIRTHRHICICTVHCSKRVMKDCSQKMYDIYFLFFILCVGVLMVTAPT